MNLELLHAIQESRFWLDRFARREYPKAFREYTEQYGAAFAAETAAAESLDTLAETFLDALEDGWKRRRFWNRSAVRVDEKRMIVSYLSPMLMKLEGTLCPQFAQCLQSHWKARWPKDDYGIATYEVLQDGFRNSVLGIDLANKHIDPERDR